VWAEDERKLTLSGQGRFSLETAHQSGKRFDLVGKILSPADRFSAHLRSFVNQKRQQIWDFLRFQDWPRTCNIPGYQDIVRDRQGVSA
jgi:hypothetical protein